MRVLGPSRPGPKKRFPVVPLHVLLSVWARQAPATFMIRPYHGFAKGWTDQIKNRACFTGWHAATLA